MLHADWKMLGLYSNMSQAQVLLLITYWSVSCGKWLLITTKERLGEPRQVHQHHASHDLCAEQIAWLKKRGSHPKGFLNTTQILWLDHFPLLKHEETTNWGKIMHFPMHPVQHSGFKAWQDHPLFQGSLAVVGARG